jgi:hypothetical protein
MRESKGMSPGAMGILGMGLSMAATPPRAIPYSTTEIIGRSGLAGLGMYEKALEDKRKQQALDVSAEEHRLTREDQKIYRKAQIVNMEAQRRNEADRITELNAKRDAEIKLLDEKTLDKKQQNEAVGPNNLGINPEWPVWKATKLLSSVNQSTKPVTAAKSNPKEIVHNGVRKVVDFNNLPDDVANDLGTGAVVFPDKASTTKPTALSEKMALAEQALQDEYSRNNLMSPHRGDTAPPPMTKKFTTSVIAAKAEDMFGKKTAPGKLSSAGAGALARKGAAPGTAGKTRPVKMPDGSIWYFDAAGNRVR